MKDLLYCNPWRHVDAWWQRAVGIMDRGEPWASPNRDSGRGSGWIKRAERFRHALLQAQSHHGHMQLIREYPEIFYAHELASSTTPNSRMARWTIEARILARQSDDEIAQANGCWPGTIDAYESLFFNVRDRLDRRDIIFNGVLNLASNHDLNNQQDGRLWKLLGYLGGPHVLEAVISQTANATWVRSPDGLASFFQDVANGSMKLKAAVAALSIPVDGRTRLPLIEAFTKYIEVERNTGSIGQANDQIQENLQAMLQDLPFKAIGIADIKQLPAHETGAAEMRTEELLHVAAGLPVPGLDLLKDIRYPEQAQGRGSPSAPNADARS